VSARYRRPAPRISFGWGSLTREAPVTAEAQPRAGARARWRVMYGYVRPHRRTLLAGGGLNLLTGATGLALPLVVRG
jgi:hypothetical protein